MRAARFGVTFGLCLCTTVVLPSAAHAEPAAAEAELPADPATIPVRIEAGGDTVSIDDARCRSQRPY